MGELVNNGDKQIEIDERWWDEWIEWGLAALGQSLRNHAKFDEYCRKQESIDDDS